MQDEPRARKTASLGAEMAGRAMAEAQAARVLERAKAPRVARASAPPRAAAPGRGRAARIFARSTGCPARCSPARPREFRLSPLPRPGPTGRSHLARAPGKRLELAQQAAMTLARFGLWLPNAAVVAKREAPAEPAAGDRRFSDAHMVAMAVQRPRPKLSGDGGLVAGGDQPRSRAPSRPEAEAAFMMRVLLDAFSPSNIPWLNPVIVSKTAKEGGFNLDPRRGQLARRPRPHARRRAARGGGGVRGRAERGGHARQGRLSQRPHRADPVRADDRQGIRGADPDRPRLDHEVLHPRSRAAELARALPRRARPHRVRRSWKNPDASRPQREPR